MILRTKILPKTIQDAFVTFFMLIIIPVVYWFELFVVLPTFYEQWCFWYTFHFVIGTYILLNISSNYVAMIVCDTSIKGRILPTTIDRPNLHFCSVCEALVPPRSWHCNACNVCILKRDHHCMFTSCCIGHYNQRYFLVFVLFLFIATVYATYYNTYFIVTKVDFRTFVTFIKIIFPLAMLFLDQSSNQAYLFLYLVVVIGSIFTGVLLYFHINLMLRGVVTHERNNKLNEYDLGKMQNVQGVLGERWYLVWISPFITSKLPQDGIQWNTKSSIKAK